MIIFSGGNLHYERDGKRCRGGQPGGGGGIFRIVGGLERLQRAGILRRNIQRSDSKVLPFVERTRDNFNQTTPESYKENVTFLFDNWSHYLPKPLATGCVCEAVGLGMGIVSLLVKMTPFPQLEACPLSSGRLFWCSCV